MNAEDAAKKERARIADGLAAGKTFYLRGGKKLKGKKAEKGAGKSAPAVPLDTTSKSDKDKDK